MVRQQCIIRSIKENYVVIICDKGANQNVWDKGIVVSLVKDRYGVARKVEVRMKKKDFVETDI